jgi:ankyrin repeat protein
MVDFGHGDAPDPGPGPGPVRLAALALVIAGCGLAAGSEIIDAAGTGYNHKVEALLKEQPDLVKAKDDQGRTPLHLAAEGDHWTTIELLVRCGADVNAADDQGRTPLHLTARYDSSWAANTLVRLKADVDARDAKDRRPLQCAEEAGAVLVAARLRSAGAKGGLPHNAELHEAVRRDAPQAVARLLKAHPEVIRVQGPRLVLLALDGKSREALRALLDAGADPNPVECSPPLGVAVRQMDMATVRLLLEHKADPNRTWRNRDLPIFVATGLYGNATHDLKWCHPDDVKRRKQAEEQCRAAVALGRALLEAGADPNLTGNPDRGTVLHAAAWGGSLELARLALEHGAKIRAEDFHKKTPLITACQHPQPEMIRFLIETERAGHGKVARADEAFWIAVHYCRADNLEALLAAGLEPAAGKKGLEDGLHWLFNRNQWDKAERAVAEVLIAHGADVNARRKIPDGWVGVGGDQENPPEQKGVTPLHRAADRGDVETARLLLKLKASVDARDDEGRTALMRAVPKGKVAMIKLLLEHGANPEILDVAGHSALDLARTLKREDILELLRGKVKIEEVF